MMATLLHRQSLLNATECGDTRRNLKPDTNTACAREKEEKEAKKDRQKEINFQTTISY